MQDRKCTRFAHSQSVSSFTSDSSRRFSTLRRCQYSPEGPWHTLEHPQPALVASRFNESSLSPSARTCPQKAKVVEVWSALPSASTSTMLICTDAWSLDVINRSIEFLLFFSARCIKQQASRRTGGRALSGDVEIDKDTLKTHDLP